MSLFAIYLSFSITCVSKDRISVCFSLFYVTRVLQFDSFGPCWRFVIFVKVLFILVQCLCVVLSRPFTLCLHITHVGHVSMCFRYVWVVLVLVQFLYVFTFSLRPGCNSFTLDHFWDCWFLVVLSHIGSHFVCFSIFDIQFIWTISF